MVTPQNKQLTGAAKIAHDKKMRELARKGSGGSGSGSHGHKRDASAGKNPAPTKNTPLTAADKETHAIGVCLGAFASFKEPGGPGGTGGNRQRIINAIEVLAGLQQNARQQAVAALEALAPLTPQQRSEVVQYSQHRWMREQQQTETQSMGVGADEQPEQQERLGAEQTLLHSGAR